jgi:hypothetical protein
LELLQRALRLDPLRFLSDLRAPVSIDEAQLVPELPVWITRIVDERNGKPGQFVLAGSARLGRNQLGAPIRWRDARCGVGCIPSRTPSARIDPDPWPVTSFVRPTGLRLPAHKLRPDLGCSRTSAWESAGHSRSLRPGDGNSWNLAMSAYVDSVIPLGASPHRTQGSDRTPKASRYRHRSRHMGRSIT